MEATSWLDTIGASLELTFCPRGAQTGNFGFTGFCEIVIARHKMEMTTAFTLISVTPNIFSKIIDEKFK